MVNEISGMNPLHANAPTTAPAEAASGNKVQGSLFNSANAPKAKETANPDTPGPSPEMAEYRAAESAKQTAETDLAAAKQELENLEKEIDDCANKMNELYQKGLDEGKEYASVAAQKDAAQAKLENAQNRVDTSEAKLSEAKQKAAEAKGKLTGEDAKVIDAEQGAEAFKKAQNMAKEMGVPIMTKKQLRDMIVNPYKYGIGIVHGGKETKSYPQYIALYDDKKHSFVILENVPGTKEYKPSEMVADGNIIVPREYDCN